MQKRWLFLTVLLAGALAFFDRYGVAHDLYRLHWWYDIPMHLLGGATITAFVIALTGRYRPWIFWTTLFVASVGWEIFEYVGGLSKGEPNYWFDTGHDLLDDVIGGVIIWRIAKLWH